MSEERIIDIRFLEHSNEKYIFRKLNRRVQEEHLYNGNPKLLVVIHEHGGLSQAGIAKMLNVKPASLTTMLQRMESRGLIERRQEGRDCRSLHVYLTDEGQREVERLYKVMCEVAGEAYRCLTEEELEQYYQLVKKINQNLKEENDEMCQNKKEERL